MGGRDVRSGVVMMGGKIKLNCRRCGEPILLVESRKGKWRPKDFPGNSISGNWENHVCAVDEMRGKY